MSVQTEMRNFQVLVKPVVTEKSAYNGMFNTYVFQVRRDSNATQIKRAVEAIYGVSVVKISVLNRRGKVKRTRRGLGRTNHTKMAYVRVADGQAIDFFEKTDKK